MIFRARMPLPPRPSAGSSECPIVPAPGEDGTRTVQSGPCPIHRSLNPRRRRRSSSHARSGGCSAWSRSPSRSSARRRPPPGSIGARTRSWPRPSRRAGPGSARSAWTPGRCRWRRGARGPGSASSCWSPPMSVSSVRSEARGWLSALGVRAVTIEADTHAVRAAAPGLAEGAGLRLVAPDDPLLDLGLATLVQEVEARRSRRRPPGRARPDRPGGALAARERSARSPPSSGAWSRPPCVPPITTPRWSSPSPSRSARPTPPAAARARGGAARLTHRRLGAGRAGSGAP